MLVVCCAYTKICQQCFLLGNFNSTLLLFYIYCKLVKKTVSSAT